MQLAEPAAVTSARARPVLEVKDLRTYFPMEMAPVPAVNGVILTVGEDEGYILDRVDHPRGRRECLVSAATCMSWLGMRDSVPRTGIWEWTRVGRHHSGDRMHALCLGVGLSMRHAGEKHAYDPAPIDPIASRVSFEGRR